MSLQFIIDSQKKFQERMGHDFLKMTREERSKYLKEHGSFLIEETIEMFREMPYHKSWKDYSDWKEERHESAEVLIKEEAIDMLHFMINILIALDMDEEQILKMYQEKNRLNYQRQVDSRLGYVTTKSEEN